MKDGGPAFPIVRKEDSLWKDGMSLRDYFAAAALQGMVSKEWRIGREFGFSGTDEIAQHAYHYADAMLAEREKK